MPTKKPKHLPQGTGKPSHWSISNLDLFDRCPALWKHKYLDGNELPSSEAMTWGRLCHLALEHVNRFAKVDREGLSPEIAQGCWDRALATIIEQGGSMIGLPSVKDGVEGTKRYAEILIGAADLLFVEETIAINFGGVPLIFKPDLVTVNEFGTLRVVDFKSSPKIPSKDEVADNFQLLVYAAAIRKALPDLLKYPKIEIGIYSIAKAALVYVEVEESSHAITEEFFRTTVERVKAEKAYEPKRDPDRCFECPIRAKCPAFTEWIQGRIPEGDVNTVLKGTPQEIATAYEAAKNIAKMSDARADLLRSALEIEVMKAGSVQVADGRWQITTSLRKEFLVKEHYRNELRKAKK